MPTRTIACADDNIGALRERYPDGLHFAVGDTHTQFHTLNALMDKIAFDPRKDHVYFVGDYNGGGHPHSLLAYISEYYQEDYARPGFHLIRGNHERELGPYYELENLTDIIVLRAAQLNYYIVHAGMTGKAFRLINYDMAISPDSRVHAYRLDDSCACYNGPLRQITWSMHGLYSQRSKPRVWPSESELAEARACIIHGHAPYCFFMKKRVTYGDVNVFWQNQHILFSEDLQSFNIDSNVKGRNENGENYRGLACVCLEAIEEIAAAGQGRLTVEGICAAPNFVFAAEHVYWWPYYKGGDIGAVLGAAPRMKTITLGEHGEPVIKETKND